MGSRLTQTTAIFAAMKAFAFFMAVLVLVLSLLPCADANRTGESLARTEIKPASHQDDPHSDSTLR